MADVQNRRTRTRPDPAPIADIRKLWQRAREETGGLSDLAKPEDILNWARMIGRDMEEWDLRCPQFRRVLRELKCIEAMVRKRNLKEPLAEEFLMEIVFLRPYMTYAARRYPRLRLLRRFLDHCLDPAVLKTGRDLVYLVKFLDAVVAYVYQS